MSRSSLSTNGKAALMRRLFLPLLIAILLSCIVAAQTSYPNYGTSTHDFHDTTGGNFVNASYTAKALNTPQLYPLVSDLDGDGVNEVIALDGDNIRLYHGSSLSTVDTFTLPTPFSTGEGYEDIDVADLDGDGLKEIIVTNNRGVSGNDPNVTSVDWNGSTMTLKKSYDLSASTTGYGYMTTSCNQATSQCLVVKDTKSAGQNLEFFLLDSTGVLDHMLLVNGNTSSQAYCVSKLGDPPVADHDGNSVSDFWVSIMRATNTGDDFADIYRIQATGGKLYQTKYIEKRQNVYDGGAGAVCDDTISTLVTQPLVADIDDSTSDGLEFVFGLSDNINGEFHMYSYTKTGAALDDYPEIEDADGNVISPVMQGYVFPDVDVSEDFCVLGYSYGSNVYDLLCASENTGLVPETHEFFLDPPPYNITLSDGLYFPGFLGQYRSATETTNSGIGGNLDELIMSAGIYWLDWKAVSTYELVPIVEAPWSVPASVVPVDAEKVGASDILAITENNLYYWDDGFTFQGCGEYFCILDDSSIDPDPNYVWIKNTTVRIYLHLEDIDGDNVSGRVVLYDGDDTAEQDSGWIGNYASGTTIPIIDVNGTAFIANKTGNGFTLTVQARDDRDPTSIESQSFAFSVSATSGIAQGDAVLEFGTPSGGTPGGSATAINQSAIDADQGDNAIANTLDVANKYTNLGYTVLWLLIVGGIVIYVALQLKDHPGMAVLMGVLIAFFGVIIGAFLGFVGLGVIIGFVIVCIVVGIFALARLGTGGG